MANIKAALALVAGLLGAGPALAQAPTTTRPSAIDMLTSNCAATNALIGGTLTPGCGPAFGSTSVASTLVQRDASGNFSAGTITAALTGHANLDLALTGGTLTGALLFTDNSFDIGAAGATRPRTGYFGTSLISPLFNGLAITNNGTNTLAIAAGKTLTSSNTLTLSGTDGSTLNVGGGGMLGSNAFTSTAYAPLASPTFTGTVTVPTLAATTINAFALGGAVSGGGNQVNNVIVGTSTPLAGFFTTLSGTTSVTSPIHYGGAAAGSTLTLQSTSSGSPSADSIIFKAGGATRWTVSTSGHLFSNSTDACVPATCFSTIDTGANSAWYLGQDASHNFGLTWTYSATAGSAQANIATNGYNNLMTIDASTLYFNANSGGPLAFGAAATVSTFAGTTDASSSSVAANVMAGGLGVAKKIFAGTSVTAPAHVAGGSVPVGTTGTCTASSFGGGATAGTFSAAVCIATNTFILSSMPSMPTGYSCDAQDRTTSTARLRQTATTATSATFTVDVATVAADSVTFKCIGY